MQRNEELQTLLERLKAATEQRKYRWAETPTPTVFRMDLPTGDFFRLSSEGYYPNEETGTGGQEDRFVLALHDAGGNLIEEWSSTDPALSGTERLEEIYHLARRNALKVEEKVKKIINLL